MSNEERRCGESPTKTEYVTGKAQSLRTLLIRTKEAELYLQQIQALMGCPKVTISNLRLMVPLAQQVLQRPIGRLERRGKWVLLRRMMEAFPLPDQFMAAAVRARLPFVQNLTQ